MKQEQARPSPARAASRWRKIALSVSLCLGLWWAGAASESTVARWSPPARIATGELHEYPDITADASGTAWVSWVGVKDGQERIYVRAFKGVEAQASIDVGLARGIQGYPRILAGQDRLYVVWCLRIDGGTSGVFPWQVMVRELVKGVPGEVWQASLPEEDALRPVVALDGAGVPWVAWESRIGRRFRIMLRRIDAEGRLQLPLEVSGASELNLRPALAPTKEGGLLVVWDAYEAPDYHIVGRRVRPAGQAPRLEPAFQISAGPGAHVGASVTLDSTGRHLIAWSTNIDARGVQRVGRTIRIRALENNQLSMLSGGEPPTILTAPDRLDVLEFPTLIADEQNRLWLLLRRGQGWLFMGYENGAWKTVQDLSEKGWGGRGREMRAVLAKDGLHVVARRLHLNSHQLVTLPKSPASPLELTALGQAPAFVGTPPTPSEARHSETPPLDSATPGLQGLWKGAIEPLLPSKDAPTPLTPEGASLPASVSGTVLEDGVGPPRRALPSTRYEGVTQGTGAPMPARLPTGFYFGDVHTHTWISDGAGDPDEVYTRSRDRYRYHFVAVTDHDLENGNRILPSEWAFLKLWAEFFNVPNRFVTFQAYEWTAASYPRGAGHRNVYFPGDDPPLFNVAAEAPDSRTLFDLLEETGALAAPHHIAWTGTDWENVDPAVQRAVEMVSVHGAFERPGIGPVMPRDQKAGMFIRDGLLRGLKFGFLGGSDGHGFPWHYGVSRREDVWRTGLTGIISPTLNRTSLHAAMMNRMTVATSGAPVALWFTINGSPMGTELTTDRAPMLSVRVEGTAPLKEVTLVRDGEDIRTLPVSGKRVDEVFSDEPSPGEHFYFVRVVQSDAEMAWSSPIWVEVKGQEHHGPPDP